MSDAGETQVWLSVLGLVLGMAFGAVVASTNFCAMGGVSDIVLLRDGRRMRAWLLAGVTAIAGTQLLAALGLIRLDETIYVTQHLNWLGHIVGGVAFGVGMVLAGGCVSRNLVRAGGGDVRSFVVLAVVSLTALSAQSGLLSSARRAIAETWQVQVRDGSTAAASLAALMLDVSEEVARIIATVAIAGALAALILRERAFRMSPHHIASGLGVGLCVVAGWLITILLHDELTLTPTRVTSLTFVGPMAEMLTWSDLAGPLTLPGFSIATIAGTCLGASVVALTRGRFRLEGFTDLMDAARSIAGGALMGVGGVMALGCTIGQGITGVGTLSVGSLLSLVSLVTGARLGLYFLMWSIDVDD